MTLAFKRALRSHPSPSPVQLLVHDFVHSKKGMNVLYSLAHPLPPTFFPKLITSPWSLLAHALLRQFCCPQDMLPGHILLKDTPAPSRSAELTEAPPGWPPFSEACLYRLLGWPDLLPKIQMCHVSNQLSAVHQKIILDHKVIDTSLIICLQNSQCFLNWGVTCPDTPSSYDTQWIFALSSLKCSCIFTKNLILFKKHYLRSNI